MLTVKEGALEFSFPAPNVRLLKYDDSDGYRNHLLKGSPDCRGVDILCLSPDNVLWLVEVKDYRLDEVQQDRSELADVVVRKVLDTLAGLMCLKHTSFADADFAKAACSAKALRVVAHVEGRGRVLDKAKKLRKTANEERFLADLKARLLQKMVKLGIRPQVGNLGKPPAEVPWKVSSLSFKAK